MSLQISRILHAGYVLENEGDSIVFDPVFENPFSRNCHAFPNVEFDSAKIRALRFDAVFISHFHDDHCSLESLDLLDRDTPIYLYCLFDELFDWIRALGFRRVIPLRLNEPVRIGSFDVIPRRALDADVDSIFQVRVAGMNLLNVVDAWIDPETVELLEKEGPWDFVMWPFQTMREIEVLSPSRHEAAPRGLPPEWNEPLRALRPRYLVPSSCQFIQEPWSWYRNAYFPISYRDFRSEIERILPETAVVRMNPSVAVRLTKGALEPARNLEWARPTGGQDVDYEYLPGKTAPPTSEVARHFPAPSDESRERVRRFCEIDLPEKFQGLEISEHPYFRSERLWRLSLFDVKGESLRFHYRVKENNMRLLAGPDGPAGWSTEAPIWKIASALETREALTSLYIRVNDEKFEASIESELRDFDVLEDPLIRVLSVGSAAAFQRAQLEKILGIPAPGLLKSPTC